ncbi:TetR/AcrR family transcriptional regulator [Actinokineospora fastidiosa]|uniref:TetR family transcriptional regulator n=1 Tax=Actinokineospora fastidiosa TaxID=1816 RepID=A0A918GDA8_9PSEU|nr:TetR/AcrR family transcriptional regulator [Actinokineospora fastidiosa]GGS30425.1 TetR family transcriptional regulator [Actinokineospora fastidiosa]
MGHREDLLAGAKRCLIEKGYARTTARDIVAASGANLASIGYHYGSKEALLNAALVQVNAEWGAAVGEVVAASRDFEAAWTRVTELFAAQRELLVVTFEALAQAEHAPEIRAALASGLDAARACMAKAFLDNTTDDTHRAVGSFCLALLTGVMAQWLIDPATAPTAKDLTLAIRTIATR